MSESEKSKEPPLENNEEESSTEIEDSPGILEQELQRIDQAWYEVVQRAESLLLEMEAPIDTSIILKGGGQKSLEKWEDMIAFGRNLRDRIRDDRENLVVKIAQLVETLRGGDVVISIADETALAAQLAQQTDRGIAGSNRSMDRFEQIHSDLRRSVAKWSIAQSN